MSSLVNSAWNGHGVPDWSMRLVLENTFGDGPGGFNLVSRLTRTEYLLLAVDVRSIMAEEACGKAMAAGLLRSRIGGPANLRSYVDCLIAGYQRSERFNVHRK